MDCGHRDLHHICDVVVLKWYGKVLKYHLMYVHLWVLKSCCRALMTMILSWVMVMWSEVDVIHSRHDHNGLSHMVSERDGAVISLPVIVMVCFYYVYLRMELWGDSLSTCDIQLWQGESQRS